MTVREFERRATQRRQSDHEFNPHQVLTFLEWCKLNKISPATGRRIRKSGKGPRFIQLSDKRIGVTAGENHAWQEARAPIDQD